MSIWTLLPPKTTELTVFPPVSSLYADLAVVSLHCAGTTGLKLLTQLSSRKQTRRFQNIEVVTVDVNNHIVVNLPKSDVPFSKKKKSLIPVLRKICATSSHSQVKMTWWHISNGQTLQLCGSGSHCWDHEPALVCLSEKTVTLNFVFLFSSPLFLSVFDFCCCLYSGLKFAVYFLLHFFLGPKCSLKPQCVIAGMLHITLNSYRIWRNQNIYA